MGGFGSNQILNIITNRSQFVASSGGDGYGCDCYDDPLFNFNDQLGYSSGGYYDSYNQSGGFLGTMLSFALNLFSKLFGGNDGNNGWNTWNNPDAQYMGYNQQPFNTNSVFIFDIPGNSLGLSGFGFDKSMSDNYGIQNNPQYGSYQMRSNSGISSKYNTKPGEVKQIVNQVAAEEGLDPNLLMAVIQQESAFKQTAKSHCGAKGYMQLMPATARETARELGMGSNFDVYDAETNIRLGARYLKKMLKYNNGNVPLALASYNAGYGNVKKHGGIPPFQETQNYVTRIMKNYTSC